MIDLTQVSVSGSAKVNVYALDGPDPGALVGTALFEAGTRVTINSFACREQMCFRLEVAADKSPESSFDSEGKEAVTVGWREMGGVGGGLRLDYGC